MAVWCALLLLLTPAAPLLVEAAGGGKIVVSKKGLAHLDANGSLIDKRLFSVTECGEFWSCRSAVNIHNGTVCWSSPEIAAVRCAQLGSLDQAWDLPPPGIPRNGLLNALTFDWISQNWFFHWKDASYVCSYQFDQCFKLGQSIRCGEVYHAAYDITHGVAFRVEVGCTGPIRLESERLDGTGIRVLQSGLKTPVALAVDPATQRVFWLDSIDASNDGVFSVNYNGQGRQQVMTVPRQNSSLASGWVLDVSGGIVTVMQSENGKVTAISTAFGASTTPVESTGLKKEEIPALAGMGELLAVTTFPPAPPRRESDSRCDVAGCKDMCIPMVVDGTPAVSCLCPEGFVVAGLTCQKKYSWYVVVAARGALNLVDLRTDEMSEILSVEDVMDVDFLWTSDGKFLLFWVAGGSLFRGRWSPGETVGDVRRLVTATSGSRILEIAVHWGQHNPIILWLEKTDSETGSESSFAVKIAPLDGSYTKTILTGTWREQRSLTVAPWIGSYFGFTELDSDDIRHLTYSMSGQPHDSVTLSNFGNVSSGMTTPPAAFTVGLSPGGVAWRTTLMWVNKDRRSLEQLAMNVTRYRLQHTTVLVHPSLADAGGLDVLDGRVFWTERSSGRLWTAGGRSGNAPRALPTTAGGGTVKILHPWRQPELVDEPSCHRQDNSCSHFCVNLYADPTIEECLCPDGMELGEDQKDCRQQAAADAH